MKRFLIIQTAFIGDVVLATPLIENLRTSHPDAEIDFMLRKGNEGLLTDHPHLREVLIWNKKEGKYKNLLGLLKKIRGRKYDVVINLQRFGATGLLTAFSGGRERIGFSKNPFSRFFTRRIHHAIGAEVHEVDRNLKLLEGIADVSGRRPRLYPNDAAFDKVKPYTTSPYICIAPTSVWFTKQVPQEKWLELISTFKPDLKLFLMGGPADREACQLLADAVGGDRMINLAGELNFLESAALMKDAQMNYVNDSAPMHMASAMNAPTTAFFCSTIPDFGFGPLSDRAKVVETPHELNCRPCGLHGKRACPKGHFECALTLPMLDQ